MAEPQITVVERSVVGKRLDQSLCEDVVVVTRNHAAVVDGATDRAGHQYDGLTGGRFAALAVGAAIETLAAGADARAATDVMTAALAVAVRCCGGSPPGAAGPWANVVVYSAARREVWRVGDQHYAVDPGEPHGTVSLGSKKVDDVAYAFRSAVTEAAVLHGLDPDDARGNDPGAAAIRPLVLAQHAFANREGHPLGYPAVDGTTVPTSMIEVVPVPLSARRVVLASDGYQSLLPTVAETEAEYRRMLDADPLCVRGMRGAGKPWEPGTSGPDDRSWLLLDVSSV